MKPKLFIGSSREGLPIADALHSGLTRDAECTVWNQGIFNLSQNTLADLIKVLRQSDFGIFVFSPDDISLMRGNINDAVRDNVIFELGLFIGRLGPERSFFLVPDDVRDLRLPSDLTGITPGEYEANRSDGNLYAAVGPACGRIRRQMEQLKSFQDVVESAQSDTGPPAVAEVATVAKAKPAIRKAATTKDPATAKELAEISGTCDGAGVKAAKYKNSYLLTGETKPCKEVIKKLNGRWIKSLGGWTISPTRMSELLHDLPKVEVAAE
jgi:hypothetical protein